MIKKKEKKKVGGIGIKPTRVGIYMLPSFYDRQI